MASASALAAVLLLTLAIGGPIVAARQRAAAEEYRKLLYASDLKVALQAWQQAQLQQAVTALDRHRPQAGQRDLREFTWHYLKRLCQPYRQTRTLKTPNAVLALATTDDGKLLAAAGGMDYVTLWDLEADTDRPLRKFTTGEPYMAGPISFSRDGRYFLAGGLSRERSTKGLQIWDAIALRESGRLDLIHSDPGLPGRHCDFSPDGKLLAVPSGNEVIIKNAGDDWEVIKRLTHHQGAAWSACFSSDGKRLVTASFDKTAVVWDTIHWVKVAVLSHTNGVLLAVFSPDCQQVATTSGKMVQLWDLDSQIEVNSHSHAGFVTGLDFSPDGKLVASGAYDGLVKVWDWKADTIRTLRGHSQMVSPVKFVLGGTRLASGSWDHTVKIWDLDPPPPNDRLEGRVGDVSPLAFAPDGRLMATVSAGATNILLWREATGGLEANLPAPDLGALLSPEEIAWTDEVRIVRTAVNDLAFSRNGALAAARGVTLNLAGTISWRERIELWDVRRRATTNSIAGQMPICFSPDGRWFACQGATNGTIQFHDLETGREWTSQGGFEATPDKNEFAFSPDGRLLASSGAETVLWETATGCRVATLVSASRDREEPIRTVAFTPDGQWLIAAGINAEIQIWEPTTPRQIHSTPSHMGEITSLAVSPDGQTLATGNQVGVIKLWRLQPPKQHYRSPWEIRELLTLSDHKAGISDLQFTPAGDVLGSSDGAGVVRLWRADAHRFQ
ncbi:MAG: WD40 repeat domain-containing protein [Chloroflexi bacterium]|nr:WD40 repeat domain-containing protein [Chloroflexota bacterium]